MISYLRDVIKSIVVSACPSMNNLIVQLHRHEGKEKKKKKKKRRTNPLKKGKNWNVNVIHYNTCELIYNLT